MSVSSNLSRSGNTLPSDNPAQAASGTKQVISLWATQTSLYHLIVALIHIPFQKPSSPLCQNYNHSHRKLLGLLLPLDHLTQKPSPHSRAGRSGTPCVSERLRTGLSVRLSSCYLKRCLFDIRVWQRQDKKRSGKEGR